MSFVMALDQGTTSSRAILFDRSGKMLAVAQREFQQIFPQSGWVEHNATEIWESQIAVARQLMLETGTTSEHIHAIGITNQRETTVIWDRVTGKPIHNAIVWQDRRTAPTCDKLLEEGHVELVQRKTGLVIDAYFSGTKVKWLLDNIPGARQRAERGELAFGTIDSWLVWNLTGGRKHVTDVSNASRTLLFNLETCQWDDELLRLLDIPKSLLPTVEPSSCDFGATSDGLLGDAIAIAGIAGDQQAALFGQNCLQNGMAKNTYGTGCFMLMHIGNSPKVSKHKLLTTVAWQLARNQPCEYALEGSVFIAGAAVQWLRDGLGIIKSSGDVEKLAEQVSDSEGVVVVPAFAGLGAPHWDAYARGTIVGLDRGTTAAHIARATLESIAFQVADVLDAMRSDSGVSIKELRVDGGAAANNLLMQFQADILQVPVVRPQIIETTALGAAYLAGLATGYWKNIDELRQVWQAERVFTPKMPREEVSRRRAHWHRALDRAKAWCQ